MKHNPSILVNLAKSVIRETNVRVVVISEGLGAEYLKEQKKALGLENLLVMPFQDFKHLSQMQAAADVLIAILEPDAGEFAVPSKILSYLCSERPLLLAVPAENLAARTVRECNAGIVVEPDDGTAFIKAARELYCNHKLRQELGKNARQYPENTFNINLITDCFEDIIKYAVILRRN